MQERKENIALSDNDTIDLLALARALLNQWIAILLAMVIFGGAMGAYNILLVKPTYSAEAQIYISNNDSLINMQELQLSAALAEDYSTILTSRGVLKKVISDLNLNMDYRALRRLVSISNPKDTHILSIKATTASPEESVAIADSLMRHGIDRIFLVIGKDSPTVIDYAEADAVTVNKPSTVKQAAIGAILGMVLVGGIVTVNFLMDNTVKSEEDVRRLTDYVVLAAIPEYATEEKKEVAKRGV